MNYSTPGFSVLHYLLSLLKLMSIESVIPSNHLILCRPFHLLPWIFLSNRVFFQRFGSSHQVVKVLKLQLQSFQWIFRIDFFRIDWFDLLAVQGTLKSLLQHHSSKASILQRFSLLYGPTVISIHDYWKNHSFDYTDLCWQSNIPAFFNTLSRFVIAFPPRSKHLLIS